MKRMQMFDTLVTVDVDLDELEKRICYVEEGVYLVNTISFESTLSNLFEKNELQYRVMRNNKIIEKTLVYDKTENRVYMRFNSTIDEKRLAFYYSDIFIDLNTEELKVMGVLTCNNYVGFDFACGSLMELTNRKCFEVSLKDLLNYVHNYLLSKADMSSTVSFDSVMNGILPAYTESALGRTLCVLCKQEFADGRVEQYLLYVDNYMLFNNRFNDVPRIELCDGEDNILMSITKYN